MEKCKDKERDFERKKWEGGRDLLTSGGEEEGGTEKRRWGGKRKSGGLLSRALTFLRYCGSRGETILSSASYK